MTCQGILIFLRLDHVSHTGCWCLEDSAIRGKMQAPLDFGNEWFRLKGVSGLDVINEPHTVNHDCGEAPPGPVFDVVDFDAPFF